MTAEVAVMNGIGVALAADSAVSIGDAPDKIYTSSDKLFQLSNSAPVGVMVYGSASFVGIPWETIVKEFRRSLGSERLTTVRAYAERFFQYVQNHRMMFPRSAQEEHIERLITGLFFYVRNEIEETLDREAEERNGLEEEEIPVIATCKATY